MTQNIREASRSTAIGITILVVVLVLSPLIIFLVRNAASTIQVCVALLSINKIRIWLTMLNVVLKPKKKINGAQKLNVNVKDLDFVVFFFF